MPNGKILKGVPDGTTKAQLQQKLQANGIDFGAPKAAEPKQPGIGSNMLEAIKNNVSQTGAAISEPYNQKNVPWFMKPADAAVKTVGKLGNAIGSVGDIPMGIMQGAGASAAAPFVPAEAKGLKSGLSALSGGDPRFTNLNANLSPQQIHQQAMSQGSDLSNAAMMGMGGKAKPIAEAANAVGKVVKEKAPVFLKDETSGRQAPSKTAAPQITSDDIRAKASKVYDAATAKGGVVQPKTVDSFIAKATSYAPQTAAGKVVMGKTPVTKLVKSLDSLKGKPLTFNEVKEIDEGISNMIDGEVHSRSGRLTAQGKKLLDIQTALRDAVENEQGGFPELKTARALWAQQSRLADIERILSRAEKMDNPATGIKTGFRTLSSNPSRMRGFTAKEKALINDAAKTGITTDILRTFGSRLIPIGTLLGGGGLAGTAASEAASIASRGLASRMQAGRANKVANEIVNRQIP